MLDLTKPVQTRDGRPARILCTDFKGPPEFPVVFIFTLPNGREDIWRAKICGRVDSTRECPQDLINVPERSEAAYVYHYNIAGNIEEKVSIMIVEFENGEPVAVRRK